MTQPADALDGFVLNLRGQAERSPSDTMPLWLVSSLLSLTSGLRQVESPEGPSAIYPSAPLPPQADPPQAAPADDTEVMTDYTEILEPLDSSRQESIPGKVVKLETAPYLEGRGNLPTDIDSLMRLVEDGEERSISSLKFTELLSIIKGSLNVFVTVLDRIMIPPGKITEGDMLIRVSSVLERAGATINQEAELLSAVLIQRGKAAQTRERSEASQDSRANQIDQDSLEGPIGNPTEVASIEESVLPPPKPRKKRNWSPEQREQARIRLNQARQKAIENGTIDNWKPYKNRIKDDSGEVLPSNGT